MSDSRLDLSTTSDANRGVRAAADESAESNDASPSSDELRSVIAEVVREVLAEQMMEQMRTPGPDVLLPGELDLDRGKDELREIARESARMPTISLGDVEIEPVRRVSPFGLFIYIDPDGLENGLIHHLERIWRDSDPRGRNLTLVDCKDLLRMGSATLGQLILFSDMVSSHNAALVLVNVKRALAITLEMMGLQDELPYYETVEALVADIRGLSRQNKLP